MCVSVCVCVCMCVCVYVPPTVHISSLFAHLSHFIMKKSRIPQTYHVDVDTFDIWGMEIYIRILSRTLYAGTWRDLWTFYLERDRTFGPFIWKVTGPLDLLSGTWEDLWTFYLERDMTFGPKSQKMGLWDGVNAPLSSFKVAEDIYVIKLNGKRVRCIATTNMVFSKLHETSKTFTGTIPILSSAWEYIKIWAVLIEFESVKILVTRQ